MLVRTETLTQQTQLNSLGRATDRVWFEIEYRKQKQMFKPTVKTLTIAAMVKHQPLDASPRSSAEQQSLRPAPHRPLPAYNQGV